MFRNTKKKNEKFIFKLIKMNSIDRKNRMKTRLWLKFNMSCEEPIVLYTAQF